MKIPLDQFEQIIDENILKRGLTYKNEAITGITEISIGEYESVVSGPTLHSHRHCHAVPT